MEIKKNQPDASKRLAFLTIILLDGTPAADEAGYQALISIDGAAGITEGIGVLVAIDAAKGEYCAQLTQAAVNIAQHSMIIPMYTRAGITFPAMSIPIQIVENTPSDVYAVVNHGTYGLAALRNLIDALDLVVVSTYAVITHATYGLSALKTLIDGLVAGVWSYATRKLTSREIVSGESIARQETMTGSVSAGVINNAMTVADNDVVEIVQGNATPFTINLGTAWPLTGKKVYFTAKADKSAADATAIFDITCTVTDAVNGVCTATLTALQTAVVGKYYAEIEVRNTDESSPLTAKLFTLIIKEKVRQGQ